MPVFCKDCKHRHERRHVANAGARLVAWSEPTDECDTMPARVLDPILGERFERRKCRERNANLACVLYEPRPLPLETGSSSWRCRIFGHAFAESKLSLAHRTRPDGSTLALYCTRKGCEAQRWFPAPPVRIRLEALNDG